MASRDRKADAEEAKARGNEALAAKEWDKAIDNYTIAIKLVEDPVYYSNRSAAYLSKGFAESALKDANRAVELKPDWGKAYGRVGAALHKMGQFGKAAAAYEKGLEVEPGSANLMQGLDAVKAAAAGPQYPQYSAGAPPPGGAGGAAGGAGAGLAQLMGANFLDKVKAHPKLAKYTSDPTYMQLLQMLQSNPDMLSMVAQDPRIQETFKEVLGIQFQFQGEDGSRAAATPEEREAAKKAKEQREKELKARQEAEAAARAEAELASKRAAESPEERAKREAQEKAEAFKEQGNAHYKNKEFAEAERLYRQAIETDPDNMIFHLNLASVSLEQGDLEASIAHCDKAIEVGKSVYAGYEKIAKAYERKGNAYFKFKKYDLALQAYGKAQIENSSSAVANQIKKVEILKKKEEDEAYLDPARALEAKEKGNERFKAGDFIGSLAHYSDAVKRDPKNPVFYSNRAAAYMKVMDFGRAMDDTAKAIELDPKNVKNHVRKANIHFLLKEYHKCLRAYGLVLELEPDNKEAQEGLAKTRYAIQTSSGENDKLRAQRAMEDPEIQGIMSDPVMQQVLRDMSSDPGAVRKHMGNPEVASKIEVLIAAGILQTK